MSRLTPATGWQIFRGDHLPHTDWKMPEPPPWRRRRASEAAATLADAVREPIGDNTCQRGHAYQSEATIRQMVNAALYLRRPLLVTGAPGSGKSSLVDAVAYELGLGEPLRWPVTSRSTLREGLYTYDAIGRAHDTAGPVASHIQLGPLGTAMLPALKPRVLLIDEIDKADVDLPNDLLNVIEEAYYDIPELARVDSQGPAMVRGHRQSGTVRIDGGKVESYEFPLVVMTSNGERDFPAPFLRRCLQVRMPDHAKDPERLRQIVEAHLGKTMLRRGQSLIRRFVQRAEAGEVLATDQLLNAILLTSGGHAMGTAERQQLVQRLTEAIGRQGL